MKIHHLTQGSPEWLAYRAQHFNASDAPAMMGCSPYKTRAQLLHELHTGLPAEADVATQKRFDNGHRAEALARPLAEQIVGEELYPVTGSLGRLSASFDGLTLDESEGFEHKALNDELRAAFRAIDTLVGGDDTAPGECLPLHHRVQMEQQLHVSGARRILFMTTAWDADGNLQEEHSAWYYGNDELRAQILRGWDLFAADLAAYVPPQRAEPVTAAPVEALPAVAVRMDGALVVQSNLPAFGVALREFVGKVPKRPSTDQEFADTEAACKALKRAEEALDAAEANALASLEDVNAMRRMVPEFRDLARSTRLAAEKLVDRRKVEIREEAVMHARRALDAHIASLNAEIAPMRVQMPAADFAGAIKGKRSITSMQDALDAVLVAAKLAAEESARLVRANAATYHALADGYEFLFADLAQLIHKPADDFRMLVGARVDKHKADEAAREAKRQAEAAEAEAQRQAQAAAAAAAAAPPQPVPDFTRIPMDLMVRAAGAPAPMTGTPAGHLAQDLHRGLSDALASKPDAMLHARQAAAAIKPEAAEPATLTLGAICDRLGVTVRGQFLADVLHIKPARVERGASYYSETQYQQVCRQLISHIGAMAELYGSEVAA